MPSRSTHKNLCIFSSALQALEALVSLGVGWDRTWWGVSKIQRKKAIFNGKITIFNGKIHYFYGHVYKCYKKLQHDIGWYWYLCTQCTHRIEIDMYYVYDYICIFTYYMHIIDVFISTKPGLKFDLQWVPEVPIPPVSPVMISPYSRLSHNRDNPRTNRCR